MQISILSDFHFGYGWNTRLEEDSFDNAKEAISKSLNSDLILIAGDIFDSRLPRTETWAKALRVLSKPLLSKSSGIKLLKTLNKDLKEISKRCLSGIPVVAIHGTHERRAKDQINAIEALEQAGFLIYIHNNGLIFEKNGEKVAVQGMSGVPERYAKNLLDDWNPKPVDGCYNILMLHQSIEPYVYSPLEPPTLNLSNLPEGFDLIIDGHIHTRELTKIKDTILLFPGSTIVTQLKPEESEVQKGFYQLDTEKREINFIPLEKNRRFFYREVELGDDSLLQDQIEKVLDEILKKEHKKIPMIKIKIFGKETELIDKELRKIEKNFSDKAILYFSKQLESPEITRKIEILRDLRERKMSIEEIGLELLRKNLEELKFSSSFDISNIFKLLAEGETEKAFDIITGKQKTLMTFGR